MESVGIMEVVMKWQCPRPEKARRDGCLDLDGDGSCTRKEWPSIGYFKDRSPLDKPKVEVYCERVRAVLRES
jgi:hypothetical protein